MTNPDHQLRGAQRSGAPHRFPDFVARRLREYYVDRLQNAWGGSHPLLYMTPPPDALHLSSNDYLSLLDESALRQHQAQVLLNNKRELLMSSAFLHRDSPQHAFERRLAHFISCSSEFKEYFACESRPAIFSSGLLAHEIAWFDAALPFISTAHGRRVRLHQMARYVRRELTRLGYALSEGTEQIIALESGTERNTLRLRDALRRVALLLLRETGMRCSEAANATRDNLVPRQANGAPAEQRAVWSELRVLGKGNRERMVPISRRLVAALEAYWQDRKAINPAPSEEPLIAPLAILKTPRARSKQRQCRHGYSDRGLRQLVNDAAEKFGVHLAQENPELLADMGRIHPHAFRHAFGSHGLAAGMALNVMQGYLGHASIATTTLYSTADRDRRLQDVEKFYRGS